MSLGHIARGALRRPALLPPEGDGYVIPPEWRARGAAAGTDELIGLIARAARRVRALHPGAQLGVGDVSVPGGGPCARHRSHQSGRDADLHFYSIDERGLPLPPPERAMVRYRPDGASRGAGGPGAAPAAAVPGPTRRLDVPRTWALVRALLSDPVAEVQWLFASDGIRALLLGHARRAGEPRALVAHAEAVLRRPGDSIEHDDHLHVRIYCPAGDRPLGCVDVGPRRWLKKWMKHARARPLPALAPLPAFARPSALPAALAL